MRQSVCIVAIDIVAWMGEWRTWHISFHVDSTLHRDLRRCACGSTLPIFLVSPLAWHVRDLKVGLAGKWEEHLSWTAHPYAPDPARLPDEEP